MQKWFAKNSRQWDKQRNKLVEIFIAQKGKFSLQNAWYNNSDLEIYKKE